MEKPSGLIELPCVKVTLKIYFINSSECTLSETTLLFFADVQSYEAKL